MGRADIKFRDFVNLTEVELRDVLLVRNEERVRHNMYDQKIISMADHMRWCAALRGRTDCRYWGIYFNGKFIGAVDLTSLDLSNGFAEWGFYLSSKSLGFGAIVEFLAMDHFFKDMGLKNLKACVLEDNYKVYNMHIQSFGFSPAPCFSLEKDGRKYLGLLLNQDEWYAKREKLLVSVGALLTQMTSSWE